MSVTITGRVYRIFPHEQKTSTFTVRQVIIDTTETRNGQTFPNHIMVQFVNNNCALLDNVKVGDVVRISYNLRGSLFNGAQGETCFNNVVGWKVEPVQVAPPQPQPVQPQYQPQPVQPQYQQYQQPQLPPQQQAWAPPQPPLQQPAPQPQPQPNFTPQFQPQPNFTPEQGPGLPF